MWSGDLNGGARITRHMISRRAGRARRRKGGFIARAGLKVNDAW
jgi:hypothetical protein